MIQNFKCGYRSIVVDGEEYDLHNDYELSYLHSDSRDRTLLIRWSSVGGGQLPGEVGISFEGVKGEFVMMDLKSEGGAYREVAFIGYLPPDDLRRDSFYPEEEDHEGFDLVVGFENGSLIRVMAETATVYFAASSC